MFVSLFGFLALAQSSAVEAPRVYETPTVRSNQCRCPEKIETPFAILEGFALDAELTLAPDGLSTNDRQATIFTVLRSSTREIEDRFKVWHLKTPRLCGVTFDYGKKYTVPVRKTEGGEFETDQCLIQAIEPGPSVQ